MTTATAVTVDGADLERLVRLAHQINADLAPFVQFTPYECTCGLYLGTSTDTSPFPDGDPVLRAQRLAAAARAKHGTHVAYHVRQALAGRIEFP
jgi:class 3 adenylate cyclase